MAGELLDPPGKKDIGQQMEEILAAGLANPRDREETGGMAEEGGIQQRV